MVEMTECLTEANLAWSLIDVAKPQLTAHERNHVFVSVGAGDTFTAIRILLKLIAVKGIPLQPSLVQRCVTWLEAYVLHEDHERLRQLIDGFSTARTVPVAVENGRKLERSIYSCYRRRGSGIDHVKGGAQWYLSA